MDDFYTLTLTVELGAESLARSPDQSGEEAAAEAGQELAAYIEDFSDYDIGEAKLVRVD